MFTTNAIKKGEVIWRFIPGFDQRFTAAEYAALPELARNYLDTYAWTSKKSGLLVMSMDNDKFVNHSDTPNTLSEYRDDEAEVITVALRDIEAGEELTDNYRSFEASENLF
jgi:hypothetical protein